MSTMIRILPMDKDNEFKDMKTSEVQRFFINDLPTRGDTNGEGKYLYKKQGIKADEGSTLILFQFDNQIIACANLTKVTKFKEAEGNYNGALYFEPSSIRIFDPVDNKTINKIFHSSIQFGQTKHHLPSEYEEELLKEINYLK